MRIRRRDTFSLPAVHLFDDRDHHVEHIAQTGFDLVEPGRDVASHTSTMAAIPSRMVKGTIIGLMGSSPDHGLLITGCTRPLRLPRTFSLTAIMTSCVSVRRRSMASRR